MGDESKDLRDVGEHDRLSERLQDCTSRASTGRIGIRHAQVFSPRAVKHGAECNLDCRCAGVSADACAAYGLQKGSGGARAPPPPRASHQLELVGHAEQKESTDGAVLGERGIVAQLGAAAVGLKVHRRIRIKQVGDRTMYGQMIRCRIARV